MFRWSEFLIVIGYLIAVNVIGCWYLRWSVRKLK